MIFSLKGTLLLRIDPTIVIDVNGVGYKVLASVPVLNHLPSLGEPVQIYTYTYVREDALELFGFLAPQDLTLFEALISVSGIGPKTAIGIFSVGSRGEIMDAIIKGDTTFFSSVPRLGKKNAQKLIIDLKSKLGGVGDALLLDTENGEGNEELISALEGFGFSLKEVQAILPKVNTEGKTPSEKIRLALKYLGK